MAQKSKLFLKIKKYATLLFKQPSFFNMKLSSMKILIYTALVFMMILSCSKPVEEPETEKSFTKLIERVAKNNFEASLIEKAEKYYPARENVVAVTDPRIEVPETKYWYFYSFDGVRVPYAVTRDAVDYYSDLIDEFNANKKDVFFISAELNYKATVQFFEKFTSPAANSMGEQAEPELFSSVYVVELDLNWLQYCGSLCAMGFNKKRIVVFNPSGEIQKVFLDGIFPLVVS